MDQKYIVVGTGKFSGKNCACLRAEKGMWLSMKKRLAHSFTAGESCAAKRLAYKQLTPNEMTAQLLSESGNRPHLHLCTAHRGMNAELGLFFRWIRIPGSLGTGIERVDKVK